MNNNTITFSGVKDGETFKIGRFELIKFPDAGGVTPVVFRDNAFISSFGPNNNLAESTVLERMKTEILPEIIAAIGEENLCPIKTDLTTLDGLKPYNELESLISLPTYDFYRANVDIFDKYKADRWWWTATPESARPHDDPDWVVCVAPSGYVYFDFYICDFGVRPFLLFVSSIFGSSEE